MCVLLSTSHYEYSYFHRSVESVYRDRAVLAVCRGGAGVDMSLAGAARRTGAAAGARVN